MGKATKNVRLIHEDKMIDVCLRYGITPKGAVMLPSMIDRIAKKMEIPLVTVLDHAMTENGKELGEFIASVCERVAKEYEEEKKSA